MKKSVTFDLVQYLLAIAGITVMIWLVQYHWNRRKLYRIAAKIPGPPGYPIIGNGLDFLFKEPSAIFKTGYRYFCEYPELFKFWLGPKLVIGISKPEHLEIVLNHPQCLDKDSLYFYTRIYMGYGLFSAPVHLWKKNRKIINPTFNQKILDSFVPVFNDNAKIFLEVLAKNVGNKDLDIFPIVSALNLDTVCETTMGISVNAQTSTNHYGKLLDQAMKVALLRIMNISYQNEFIFRRTKYAKQMDEAIPALNKFTRKVVYDKMRYYQEKMKGVKDGELVEEKNKWKPFLDHLLQQIHEGAKMTEQQVMDEVNTIMAAGTDTTGGAICFCFLTLALYPEMREKVYQEVIDVLGEDRDVTTADLPHLQLLERFIKETLRFFPMAPVFLRTPWTDVDLGDGVLPAHSTLLVSVIRTHRNEKYWNDPLKFDPDRFLPQEVAKRHPYTYLPFSGGPRGCVGSKYAIMTMKTVLATVVRKFIMKTEYKSIEDVEVKVHLLLRPADGFKVSIERRK